ncbi:hydroxymethylglutaryl-CoA reductase, degradative [Paucilactobacillus suebicus]|uniref:3-hydroxy-3-methylglutaryl coenzyme A reductase n=1 Tax=Paucilactobacillus suebicus DSM 5007 = KCTC 3549 TaxID=1423807 RepID=A0A0R1W813_9LACO|nr:hydroxymethylglutaryl-CoA reductase, degradative [Paucilactobacillus suebicus]KRM11334.1 hydroxymethylglutaryl-CoA reductase [Paucilactobacillus suebicus DSM 5007 = KCTC 3549]
MTDWQHGFYRRSLAERQSIIERTFDLNVQQRNLIDKKSDEIGNQMVENYFTSYSLPEGLALNLVVNQKKYSVPMVTEEPSVIAAASNGSKIVAKNGGFLAPAQPHLMIGQVVINQVEDYSAVKSWFTSNQAHLLEIANAAHPSMKKRGGGARNLRLRSLKDNYLSVDISIDTVDSMGANVVNTMCEAIGKELSNVGMHVITAILSNLATDSLQSVSCNIATSDLATDKKSGRETAQSIAELSHLAQIDPYRAATHNKGIMNGIDALMIATGNDWRAVESGAHAFAAMSGSYRGLSQWSIDKDILHGEMTIPLPVGTVGGSIGIVPLVGVGKQITKIDNAKELSAVVASIGLAQNLAALKALATTGIQSGHMKLQYRSLAIEVGAQTNEVDDLITRLQALTRVDKQSVRQELLKLRKDK